MLGIGLGEDGLCYRADQAVMDRNDLRERDLEVIGAQVMVDLRKIEELFADPAGAGARKTPVGR